MLHTAISVSDELDPIEATAAVIKDCRKQMLSITPQVGVVITSCMDADFKKMLQAIVDAFPGVKLIGCTTDGEICRDQGFSEDSVALLLLASENMEFAVTVAEDISKFPEQSFSRAFQECSEQLSANPACGIVFPDGITTIGIGLESLIRKVCGDNFPIFGGAAGDHYLFKTTYQFYDTRVLTDAMPMLLFGGQVQVYICALNGWTPIGPYYPVDRSEKNRVYSIDGKSALDFYQEHLGLHAPIISHIPLAVYKGESEKYFLRDSLHVREDDGSIDFIGSFPLDARIRLTTVFREDVIHAADQVNTAILSESGSDPDLVFVFSCTTRRHILGSQTNSELRVLREHPGLSFFGFYCYGEYGPVTTGDILECLNDSYVAVALRGVEK